MRVKLFLFVQKAYVYIPITTANKTSINEQKNEKTTLIIS